MCRAQETDKNTLTPPHPMVSWDMARELVTGAREHIELTTSGSTGAARAVRLSRAALMFSARATHDRLGGPGEWLLCLPTSHVAGAQVLIRSAAAGYDPVRQDLGGGFTAAGFVAAAGRLSEDRRYVSLVPTQLRRLLADDAARRALARFDAALIGGASLDPELLAQARAAEIRIVASYGMTETCGGCVYDGVPLAGIEISLDESRVLVRGPVLADGYVGADGRLDEAATRAYLTPDGWWRTQDRGRLVGGVLEITGRIDDVIITGGVNVDPGPIANAVADALHDPAREVRVIGVPDPQWGERVIAVIGPTLPPLPTSASAGTATAPVRWEDVRANPVRHAVRQRLGRESAPAAIVELDSWPLTALGKIDGAALRDVVLHALPG